MMRALLSGDLPRSRALSGLLWLIVVTLAAGPFLFNDPRVFATLGTISIFIVVVASYDLMLGYTHVVSFAHTLFFGIGAYSVAIAFRHLGNGFDVLVLAAASAVLLSLLLSLLLGALSLRVRALFFALVTLAVAFAGVRLVMQLYGLTGGEEGLRVQVPRVLGPAFHPFGESLRGFDLPAFLAAWRHPSIAWETAVFPVRFSGRHLVYYLCLAGAFSSVLFLLRVVNSPFGRVLLAIRENEFRAQALGYRTVYFRTAAVILSGVMATLAGVLFALFNRYVGPANTLDFELMVFILIMCVMGGMGTIYGAMVGTTVFMLAQNYLQDILRVVAGLLPAQGVAATLLAPGHWLLWFGLLFVVSASLFPGGMVGALRSRAARRSR